MLCRLRGDTAVRGPRLYDTPETLAMVRRRVAFYKRYRHVRLDGACRAALDVAIPPNGCLHVFCRQKL